MHPADHLILDCGSRRMRSSYSGVIWIPMLRCA